MVFLENELLYGHSFEVPEGEHVVPIGKARLYREGAHVTLVSYSIGVGIALEAADGLVRRIRADRLLAPDGRRILWTLEWALRWRLGAAPHRD